MTSRADVIEVKNISNTKKIQIQMSYALIGWKTVENKRSGEDLTGVYRRETKDDHVTTL